MKGKAFIEMQRQDLVTYNGKDKDVLVAVVDAMEEIVKECPEGEIDAKKTAEELYKKMEEKARKEHITCFTGEPLKKFIAEYLGINISDTNRADSGDNGDINLEDFF